MITAAQRKAAQLSPRIAPQEQFNGSDTVINPRPLTIGSNATGKTFRAQRMQRCSQSLVQLGASATEAQRLPFPTCADAFRSGRVERVRARSETQREALAAQKHFQRMITLTTRGQVRA